MLKYILCITLLLTLVTCGCRPSYTDVPQQAAIQKYTVCDTRGKEITFYEKPKRIASSFVYADEIILDLVDHQKIVGLSKWVHDPGLSMSCEQAADVKGTVENNLESVIALKPDLFFVADTTKKEYIDSLEDVGIKVYVFKYISRLEEIPELVRNLGNAVGEPQKAELLLQKMEDKIKAVAAKTAALTPEERKSGLLFLRFGAIGGEGCIYNDIMTAAGIEDCYWQARPEQKKYDGTSRILSKEEVLKTDPEILIIGSWSQGGAYKDSTKQLEELYSDPAYTGITAVKKKQALIIPQSYVNCLSHHAVESIEKLHTAVYETANGV